MVFKKTQHGWRLLRSSAAVLRERGQLLILAFLARIFFFSVILLIAVTVWLVRTGKIDYQQITSAQIWMGYGIIIILLWIGNIISAYFNAALLAGVLVAPSQLSLKSVIATANRRFWVILLWILIHFSFGIFVTFFRKKIAENRRVNQLLSGLSWTFATFLLPPLLIDQPVGFKQSLQHSSQLMRDFAGDQPKINYSFTWISLISRGVSFIPLLVGLQTNNSLWIIISLIITILLLLSITVMQNALFNILNQALYQYIANKKTLPHFHTIDLATAITSRV
jgi:hypothetical protein